MYKYAVLLSFLGGFLSLSIEVIWIRLFTFSSASIPQAFAFTLSIFLIGIAIGAFIGKRICQENKASVNYIGKVFIISALFDIIALISISCFASNQILFVLVVMIFCCALLRGIVFPIVHHLGAENKKTGAAISNVYFANVLGCTFAPIFIGFYLLDVLTSQQTYLVIVIITFIIAAFCVNQKTMKLLSILLAILSLGAISFPEKVIHSLSQKENLVLEEIIENKHGFIQVYRDRKNDRLVFGSNVYDGTLNVDLINNSNMIDRAYLLPIIASQAKNILVIGLSTGSWVEVLSTMPQLESIKVIELNPAYVKLSDSYSEMANVLRDKRIHLITDDGRRWLNRNPDEKFDFILMNTTYHWRSYLTNLLSKEFLELTKSRLRDNGFIYFNTTGSMDAFYTAKVVYPYVYQYKNMALASLKQIEEVDRKNIASTFEKMRWEHNQSLLFDTPEKLNKGIERMLEYPILSYKEIDFSSIKRPPEIITDRNMITEYKYGLLNSLSSD
ncbi:hypothetical protein A1D29_08110 [Pasteurellaceae bacterium Orientalotternb1]|nr:hypothetical protein A1D29_08110 [Pasteurellaceae bacterium Orientalotternb1]